MMNALKYAGRVRGPLMRSASRYSPYTHPMPEIRRSMDGQSIRLDNNCSSLRRRAQLETNRESTQPMLGDFDQKFYRPRYIYGRKFQRTWAELGELEPEASDAEIDEKAMPSVEPDRRNHWVQGQRYDDMKYDPKPIFNRKFQRTWQEQEMFEDSEEENFVPPRRSSDEGLEQQKPMNRKGNGCRRR